MNVTIVLNRDQQLTLPDSPMSPHEFLPHTAAPSVVKSIVAKAEDAGLKVDEVSAVRRTVRVSGDLEAINKLTTANPDSVEIVLGLDSRRVAEPRMKKRIVSHTASRSYTAAEVGQFYGFPVNDGTGVTVAIIELGGWYTGSDVTNVFVDGVTPVSDGPDGADGEVALDIAVVQGVAPKAKIVMYYAPNTNAGFYDAISTALHDTVNKPQVISISWGGPENSWTSAEMLAYDNLLKSAAALGIIVTVASGDNGSGDGEAGQHVDFPASSPHVLACGGTRIGTPETVWNDGTSGGATGGGFSKIFLVPDWQKKSHKHAARGVPDVAGNADPESGYQVTIDGQHEVIGGTSAVAPLWAGLIALFLQKQPSLGWFIPTLYQPTSRPGFSDITIGNNGAMKATAGWDACTGLGTPKGEMLLGVL